MKLVEDLWPGDYVLAQKHGMTSAVPHRILNIRSTKKKNYVEIVFDGWSYIAHEKDAVTQTESNG
jgi:hypothetical protein